MREIPDIRVVKIESNSSERIEKLLLKLPELGVLPIKASSMEEVSPGKWEITLSLASFLEEKEMDFIIQLLTKGGEKT